MTMTNAQRQAKYRERQLKDGNGAGTRIDLVLEDNGYMALRRLAKHSGLTIKALITRLAMREQQRVTANMSAEEYSAYSDSVTR